MAAVSLACPYCGAPIALDLDGVIDGQQEPRCPKCGRASQLAGEPFDTASGTHLFAFRLAGREEDRLVALIHSALNLVEAHSQAILDGEIRGALLKVYFASLSKQLVEALHLAQHAAVP